MLKTQFMVQQNGIRQKSLRRCCRFGHATELVFVLATGVTLLLPTTASAADLTWSTPSVGNWNATENNWNGGTVAFTNPADDAIFDPAADGATVTIDAGSITAATLTSSAIGLTINGATGTDTLAVTGLISITSGQLTLDTITTTTGAVTIASGATLNVNTNKVLSANSIDNSGALTVADGGTVEAAGEIHNESTGTVTFSGNAVLNSDSDSSGSEIVRNDGSIVVNAGVGTVDVASNALTNQGTGIIDVNTGTMNGITTLTNSSTSATAIDVASGATLGFTTLNSSAGTITAAGTLDGNVVLTGTADLDLNDGTITGTLNNQSTTAITLQGTVTGAVVQNNAGAQTTIDGATILTAGFTNTSGTLTVETGNTLTLGAASANAGTLDLNGDIAGGQTITNTGTAALAGDITGAFAQTNGTTTVDGASSVTLGMDIDDGSLTINAATTADIDIDSSATYDQNSAVTGDITTASYDANIGADITGTLTQTGGQIDIDGDTTISGAILVSGGTLTVLSPRTLTSTGGITTGVNGTLDVDGTVHLASALTNNGILDFDGDITGNQTVTNTGTATLAGDIIGSYVQSSGGTTVDGGGIFITGGMDINGGALVVDQTIQANIDVASAATYDQNAAVTGNVTTASANADIGGNITGTLLQTAGQVNIDAASTIGQIAVSGGTLDVDAATIATGLILIGGGTLNVNAATTASGDIDIQAGGTYDQNATVTGNVITSSANADIGGDITGQLQQNAGQVNIDAASTIGYIGVSGGTLTVDAATIASSGLSISSGATVNLNAGIMVTGNVTQAGSVSNTSGVDQTISTTGTWTGSGSVTSAAGVLTIVADRIVLDTNYSETGTVNLTAATVVYGSNQALSSDQASNIEVQSGDELTISSSLTVGANNGSTSLVNAGTLTINDGQTLTAESYSNTSTGTIAVGAGSTLQGTGNTLNNASALNVADGGIVIDAGAINNLLGGTTTFAGDGALDAGTGGITNDGGITVNAGARSSTQTVAVGSDALTNQGTGTLTLNSGTMNGITTLTNTSTSTTAIQVLSTTATLGFTTLSSSAGTITSTGTLDGNVALTGVADLDLDDGAITGTLDNQSTAAITIDGTVTGLFTQSSEASASTTIDGISTFTAGMDIDTGSLIINAATAADIDVASAATYDQDAAVTGNVTTASTNADIGADITGTLSQTGGQTNIDGAATIGGLITVSGGLLDVDVATTASSGISITSGVVNLNAATTLGAASSNAGTLTVGAATTLAGVLSNTGTLDVDANILGGQAVSNTGIATLSADIDGTYSQSAGSTTVDGASTISGLTSITGGAFTVNTGQTFSAAGGFTNSGGTVNLLQNATLSGTTSLLSGSLVAQASGLSITGNTTLGTSATINMADGSTFTALTVSGALTGVGGIVSLDVDLNAGTSDSIAALGSGASSGTIQIALNDLTTAGTYGAISSSGIVLLDLEATSTLTTTISGALPQDDQNVYVYSLGTINGDIVLLSGINNATAGLSGAIASAQSLVAAVINRPTSPFVTSLSAVEENEKCRPGAWVRMVGGNASATGTATTATSSTTTTTDTNFAGIQIGGDSTCFNSLIQENGWDLSYGLTAGYNIATSEQAIPGVSGAIESMTNLDMDQAYGGFYLVGARGRFSFDVQGRIDKTDFTVNSNPVGSGTALPVNDSKFDTSSYTLSAAASYAFSVPNQPQMFFVPTVGLSTTNTSDATLSFTDGSSLLLNETTTNIAFIGGTLAYSNFNEITEARTALFSTLTHYVNLSDDSTSVFTDTLSSSTDITSSALPDYTELSFGYSYNRELRRDRTTGSLRKLSVSISADGMFGSGFDSYGLTSQVRLQF